MKTLSVAVLSALALTACSIQDAKTSATNAKNDFQSCAKEQALVMMLNPTTSALPTKTMAKQITETCKARLADKATESSDEMTQIVMAAITIAKASKSTGTTTAK